MNDDVLIARRHRVETRPSVETLEVRREGRAAEGAGRGGVEGVVKNTGEAGAAHDMSAGEGRGLAQEV